MFVRFLALGTFLWAAGALALRTVGDLLLPRTAAGAFATLAISVTAFALGARILLRRVSPQQGAAAALAMMLPTLMFDGFAAIYFSAVFPNLPAQSAGVFVGWMMACCAGVALGALSADRS